MSGEDFDNIIKHDFGFVPLEKIESYDDREEAGKKIIPVDFSRPDAVNKDTSLARIFTKLETIQSVKPTMESLTVNVEIVKGYTMEEIVNWIERANDSEISAKPGFYNALMLRYLELLGV